MDLFAQCEDLVCRHSTPVMNAKSVLSAPR
ncbi:hypothetical protein PN603_12100 [Parabacteroides distasonis]|nr:hypothetical protein [Parabacteroides distasonis]MDB9135244.1 hypothetical protein [Parabacteroides distasonis]